MTKTTSNIRFNAKLLRPAEPPKGSSWTFLILPKDASAKLPTRGMTTEPRVPVDLRKALATAPKARAVWSDLTPTARRDWIYWITSAKRSETRARRIHNACEMLAAGKRRVCCFDRSGFYSKSLGAPEAAD